MSRRRVPRLEVSEEQETPCHAGVAIVGRRAAQVDGKRRIATEEERIAIVIGGPAGCLVQGERYVRHAWRHLRHAVGPTGGRRFTSRADPQIEGLNAVTGKTVDVEVPNLQRVDGVDFAQVDHQPASRLIHAPALADILAGMNQAIRTYAQTFSVDRKILVAVPALAPVGCGSSYSVRIRTIDDRVALIADEWNDLRNRLRQRQGPVPDRQGHFALPIGIVDHDAVTHVGIIHRDGTQGAADVLVERRRTGNAHGGCILLRLDGNLQDGRDGPWNQSCCGRAWIDVCGVRVVRRRAMVNVAKVVHHNVDLVWDDVRRCRVRVA